MVVVLDSHPPVADEEADVEHVLNGLAKGQWIDDEPQEVQTPSIAQSGVVHALLLLILCEVVRVNCLLDGARGCIQSGVQLS